MRSPQAVGQFYPGDPSELYGQVDRLMRASPSKGLRGVRAVLVPHAGYAYSGTVAAESFREVDGNFKRVFILASNHNGEAPLAGVSLPRETHYAIPGAKIPLSRIVRQLAREPGFVDQPEVHSMHMIEVELPFLHYLKTHQARTFDDFEIIPMILGQMELSGIQRLAEILDRHADDRALFVFSVDLSHYFPDAEARRLDQQTIRSIMSRDRDGVARATTDGNQVLLTMLSLAARRGWEPAFLKYQNSGDATGDLGRVVGYASIVFHDPLSLKEEERRELLRIARETVEETVRAADRHVGSPPSPHSVFNLPRGVFVTLEKNGELRGCIGSLFPDGTLVEGVRRHAVNAAIHDPRFSPVTVGELGQLSYKISVLDYPMRVEVEDPQEYLRVLKPRKDGVILVYQNRQSTFLPQVWEDLPDPKLFLGRLCEKQGSPPDCWRDPQTVLYRYRALEFDR